MTALVPELRRLLTRGQPRTCLSTDDLAAILDAAEALADGLDNACQNGFNGFDHPALARWRELTGEVDQ